MTEIENNVVLFTAEYIETGGSYGHCIDVLRNHHKLSDHVMAKIHERMRSHVWHADRHYEQYTKDIEAILEGEE